VIALILTTVTWSTYQPAPGTEDQELTIFHGRGAQENQLPDARRLNIMASMDH